MIKKNKFKITKKDLKGISLEQLLTKYYGKVGTKKRIAAEKELNEIAQNLEKINAAKIKKDKLKSKKK